jgi:hypothetical protein
MLLYEVQSTARKKTRITYEDKFACTKGYLPVLVYTLLVLKSLYQYFPLAPLRTDNMEVQLKDALIQNFGIASNLPSK